MKKKLLLGIAIIFYVVLAFTAVGALIFTPASLESAGRWEKVCCGLGCAGGVDYCLGSGSYTCCKALPE